MKHTSRLLLAVFLAVVVLFGALSLIFEGTVSAQSEVTWVHLNPGEAYTLTKASLVVGNVFRNGFPTNFSWQANVGDASRFWTGVISAPWSADIYFATDSNNTWFPTVDDWRDAAYVEATSGCSNVGCKLVFMHEQDSVSPDGMRHSPAYWLRASPRIYVGESFTATLFPVPLGVTTPITWVFNSRFYTTTVGEITLTLDITKPESALSVNAFWWMETPTCPYSHCDFITGASLITKVYGKMFLPIVMR